jgi:uncharacterized membrane protein YphA (DoxX/SURF4 family)
MNIILWILQILLGLLFLFAGGTKLVMSGEALTQQMASTNSVVLPVAFIKFIGVVEVLGGLGLILPGLTKIRRSLTPLAAFGLTIVMVGAVVLTIVGPGIGMSIFPLIIAILCALVAYGRRDWLKS